MNIKRILNAIVVFLIRLKYVRKKKALLQQMSSGELTLNKASSMLCKMSGMSYFDAKEMLRRK